MLYTIFLLQYLALAASVELQCNAWHTCAFERGTTAMKCWRLNDGGQLGLDDFNNSRGDEANEMGANLPLVNIGSNFVVEEMSCGSEHSCAISDERAMKCFGRNAQSQLGFDHVNAVTATGDALPFVEFGVGTNVTKVVAGRGLTCALLTDALLKCVGINQLGECGTGTTTNPIIGPPSQLNAVNLGTNSTPIDVQTLYHHVCVLSLQRTVKCFGLNRYGQLGYGDTDDRGRTTASMDDGLPIVRLGSDFVPILIATGADHSCALSTTKTVKCWGWNGLGQCGTPHSTETGDDLPVLDLGADFVPMQLALGGSHTCILSENTTIKCFGWNTRGQLGLGSRVDLSSTLTPIDLGSDFVPRQVSAGYLHTCAVSTDEGIKCWGGNEYGQLGLGHTDNMGDESIEMGDNLPFVDLAWPSTREPTGAPSSEPTAHPTTTTQPTTTNASRALNATANLLPISDSLSSTQILDIVVTAFNLSSTSPAVAVLSSSTSPTSSNSITDRVHWLFIVGLCIATVCVCFSCVGFIKCARARRHHQNENGAEQIEMHVPVHDADIEPGVAVGEADVAYEESVSNQTRAVTGGLEADEFEVVDDDSMIDSRKTRGRDLQRTTVA